MTVINKNGRSVAMMDEETRIATVQDLLDVFVSARYEYGSDSLIVFKENLCEAFFDLSTRIAGEMLQKCSNYRMRIAIVGDFSGFASKSLRDFIYESNKGGQVIFKGDLESAVDALT
jgi:hypothetical protein